MPPIPIDHAIITHTDADGIVSAAIVNRWIERGSSHGKIVHNYQWNYGNSTVNIESVLDSRMRDETTIWLTDITLPDAFMEKYASRIVWIDHHKSALENDKPWKSKLKGNYSAISAPFYLGSDGETEARQVAACELAWLKLFPGDTMPPMVRAIGRYDVWDNTEETYAAHEYLTAKIAESGGRLLRSFPNAISYPEWIFAFGDEYLSMVEAGKGMVKATQACFARQCGSVASLAEFDGTIFVTGNVGGVNSTYFDSFMPGQGDYIVPFCYRFSNGMVTVSCYNRNGSDALAFLTKLTDGLELKSIGGHKGACGCVFGLDQLPVFLGRIKVV